MDTMNLVDILMVGVPEVSLAIMIGLVIARGNIFKMNGKEWLVFVGKILLSCVIILTVIRISRSNTPNFILSSLINTGSYIVIYKIVWGLNKRNSMFIGILTMFLLTAFEILTYPIADYIMNTMFSDKSFYDLKLLLSLPPRLLQLILLAILLMFQLNLLENKFLCIPINMLSVQNKITLVYIFIFLFLSFAFSLNHVEMFAKLQINNADIPYIEINLNIILIQTLLFMIVTLILLNRTRSYEEYKEYLSQSNFDIINDIVMSSDQDELLQYSEILIKSLSVDSITKMQRLLNNLKKYCKNFDYDMTDGINTFDYNLTYIYDFIQLHIGELDKQNIKSKLIINNNHDNTSFVLSCYTDEITLKRIENQLANYSYYGLIRKYIDTTCTFNVEVANI